MKCEWVAVVPVKRLDLAKSRLRTGVDGGRSALARAFAADTVAALVAVPEIRTVVLCGDRRAADPMPEADVVWLDEPVPGGLNQAAAAGIAWARRHHGDLGVAVVPADLPALRAQDVRAVLARAAGHNVAVVADREGTGTTMLTALPGIDLEPLFGPDSLTRHRDGGAVVVSAPDLVRLARDVDTASHLAEAVALGVGSATAKVLES